MEVELAGNLVAIFLFVVVLLALHELAHVAVARAYGYPLVCLGLSPLAVGVVFLDQPVRRYWVLQVAVPMAVTAAVAYLGFFVLPLTSSSIQTIVPGSLPMKLAFSVVLSVLTSCGDLASMAIELRRPLWGRDRVVRDVRLLKRVGSLIRFTAFGKRYLSEEFGQSPREFVAAASRAGGARSA